MTLFGPGVLDFGGDALKLYTTHDHWLVCPMYDLWKQNRELCEQPECLRCHALLPPAAATVALHRTARAGAADGRSVPRAEPIDDRPAPPSRLPLSDRQLPYFLPLDEVGAPPTAVARARGRGRPYFLFVGRLVKLKGVQTLIEAFRRYDARRPPDRGRRRLRRRAAPAGRRPRPRPLSRSSPP